MPGPVSDGYDPEFGTSSNAADVRGAIDHVRALITGALGDELKHIVEVSQRVIDEMYDDEPVMVPFTEAELRVIRFCLDRAKQSV